MRNVLQFMDRALEQGQNVAMVTIQATKIHTPTNSGSMMAVLSDGSFCGTVGGGMLEYELIKRCVKALSEGEGNFNFEYDLSDEGTLKMICGGQAKGFVNILRAAPQLLIFGGGHVGRALCKLANIVGFEVTVYEDREAFQEIEGAKRVIAGNPIQQASEMEMNDSHYAVIVTRGHALDYQSLKAIVEKPAAYIGMIGSKQKVGTIMQKLIVDGISEQAIQRVYAPIGLNIDNGQPYEIAVSILAEILLVKNKGSLAHMRELQANE